MPLATGRSGGAERRSGGPARLRAELANLVMH